MYCKGALPRRFARRPDSALHTAQKIEGLSHYGSRQNIHVQGHHNAHSVFNLNEKLSAFRRAVRDDSPGGETIA